MLSLMRSSRRTLKASELNVSEPCAMKLSRVPFTVPGVLGSGSRPRMASACGESRPVGIWLPGNWVRADGAPVSGSKMLTPYSDRSPVRARAVGTVSSLLPPSV